MKIRRLFLPLITTLLFVSCGTMEEIAYVYDAPRDTTVPLKGEFSKGIQANDLLSIYVESEEPSSTIQFNQETNKIAMSTTGVVMNPATGASSVPGYLVNNEGDIIFPVLGTIHVLGLTHNELAKLIEKRLVDEGHIKDPRVTVKLMNFKVCVLGDVQKPGELLVTGERLTIFEALSMVGDLTIYGQRYNVTVIREENGQRVIGELDLSSKNVFDSPYYYLHQNDVVYVEPNMRRKKLAARDPNLISYISSAVSVVSVISTTIYYLVMVKHYSN